MPRLLRGLATLLLTAGAIVPAVPASALSDEAGPLPPPPVATPLAPPAGEAASPAAAAADAEPLVGTFRITAGNCSGAVRGSYFRMIQPGGSSSGPFVQNSDSPCADKTYTPLAPGSEGGLVTETHQAQPDPAFDSTGGGRANRITTPQRFYGVNFATATNPVDPQTSARVNPPRIGRDEAGKLSGDLRAFAASWNNQHFNQGAPKPDGSTPGATSLPSGTHSSESGAYTLEWRSQIVGGPFNNFTGQWHLEGTFVSRPSGGATGGTAAGSAGAGGTAAAPAGGRTTGTASQRRSSSASGPRALADTGPPMSLWFGLGLLAAGGAGFVAARRLRSPAAPAGGGCTDG